MSFTNKSLGEGMFAATDWKELYPNVDTVGAEYFDDLQKLKMCNTQQHHGVHICIAQMYDLFCCKYIVYYAILISKNEHKLKCAEVQCNSVMSFTVVGLFIYKSVLALLLVVQHP
jgi:hypothetical protein